MRVIFFVIAISLIFCTERASFASEATIVNGCPGAFGLTSTDPNINLSTWLKSHRKRKGLSQSEIGELIGLDRSQLSRLETGIETSTYETVAILAYVMERPVEEAFLALANQTQSNMKESAPNALTMLSLEALSQKNLGAWLRYRRNKLDITLAEIGRRLGTDHSTASRLESEATGQRANDFFIPLPESLAALARGVEAPTYEPFLVLAKKYFYSELQNHKEMEVFQEKVERVQYWLSVRFRRLPSIQAADKFEDFLRQLEEKNESVRMISTNDGVQDYQFITDYIADDEFEAALTTPGARVIRSRFLNGDYTASARAASAAGKEFNQFIVRLKQEHQTPRFPMQLIDGASLYNRVVGQVGKPHFTAELLDSEAKRLADEYVKHKEISNVLFPLLAVNEKAELARIAKDLFRDLPSKSASDSGRMFDAYVARLKQRGIRLQLLSQATHPDFYFLVHGTVESEYFATELLSYDAKSLRTQYLEKLRLYRSLRGR